MCSTLLQKYNVPGPRYTSYPTVPYWNMTTFSLEKWKSSVQTTFDNSNHIKGISLYIHLPFCESMCTFCGCNKRITKRHEGELPYIHSLLKEWELYLDLFKTRPTIKELHLGGGTPTFFSPENLTYLVEGLFRSANRAEDYEFSFEGHPNNTTKEHLQALYEVGFRRVSFGVQDYNAKVQKAIHRIQSFENVQHVTQAAREIGYTSVGHDIIYGLPFQTGEAVTHTIEKTKELLPDRLAFYSYAHVPWQKGNGQRGFDTSNLPKATEKRRQYELGKHLLAEAGYVEIGMDHFALAKDALYQSMKRGELHRNFMGYTVSKTDLMIGLGASSISDSWIGFSQNVKSVDAYQHLVSQGILPVFRGHLLNREDQCIRYHIANLMCNFETCWDQDFYFDDLPRILHSLEEMKADGLLKYTNRGMEILEKGKPFVRNICMAFDLRLQRSKPERQLFSMTI